MAMVVGNGNVSSNGNGIEDYVRDLLVLVRSAKLCICCLNSIQWCQTVVEYMSTLLRSNKNINSSISNSNTIDKLLQINRMVLDKLNDMIIHNTTTTTITFSLSIEFLLGRIDISSLLDDAYFHIYYYLAERKSTWRKNEMFTKWAQNRPFDLSRPPIDV